MKVPLKSLQKREMRIDCEGDKSMYLLCLQLPRAQFVCVAVCMPCLHFVFWCRPKFVHSRAPPLTPKYTLPLRRPRYPPLSCQCLKP